MKIASFAFRAYPAKGGVELHQKLISDFFHRNGHDVTIYTSRMENNSEYLNINLSFPFFHIPNKKPRLKNSEIIDGIKFKRFDLNFRFYSYNQMKNLYKTFEKEIKNYDIVHLHGLNVYNNFKLAKIAHKNNVPVILTCHDTIIADNFPAIVKWLKRLYDDRIVRKLNRYVNYFILNTDDQTIDLVKLGIPKKKIAVIPVGIDTEHIIIDKIKETNILKKYGLLRREYLFNIGRIEEYKGVQDILYTANDMPKQYFIIAGKDQGYLKELKNIENRLNIKNVRFIGEVNEAEKAVLLKHSKIFLFPSKREGWGIVMAEAMTYGIPCIAYNIKNIRTVFTDKKSGILINEYGELKAAIEKILDDKKWKTYSKNSLIESKKYDCRILFPKVEKLFGKNLRDMI